MNPWEEQNYYEPRTIIQQPQVKHDSLVDGVVVPGLQTLITGVLSSLAAGTLAALGGLNGWKWAAGAFVVVALASWLSYRQGWNSRLERILGIDLNRDGVIGAPVQPTPAQPESVRIELIQDEGKRGDFIDLPYPEKLPALAAGLLAGRQFAQTAWVGTGQLFSRAEFDNLRDTLIQRGLAAWKNPEAKAQGITLTLAGKAVFRRLANTPTLPAQVDR